MEDSDTQPIPVYGKVIAACMTLVVSGSGALAVINQYDPGRWTRFGYAGPFYGPTAQVLGVAMILLGLIPLGFFARSGKQAGYFCGVVGVLLMLTLIFGLRLLK